MTKVKGTSNIPMIMGIMGGVLGLPAALCSGMCGAAIDGLNDLSEGTTSVGSETGDMMLQLGLIGALLGLVGGLLGKKIPIPAGVMMIAGGILCGYNLLPLSLIVGIFFLFGGLFCFVQKKETIE
jgi:hypothetical protein